MGPLVINTAAARDVFAGFIGLWVAIELISQIPVLRRRVSRTFDPTRLFVSISIVIGFVLALRAAEHRLWMFGGGWPESEVCSVRVTTFGPEFDARPVAHIFTRSAAPWESLPDDGADRFETTSG